MLTLLLTLVGAPLQAHAQAPSLTLEPSAPQVAPGATLTLDIVVRDVANLFAVEVSLAFDPALLSVVDDDPAIAGIQVQVNSAFIHPDFVAVNQADNATGVVDLTFTQVSPSQPVSGTGSIAKVTFTAGAVGQTAVTYSMQRLLDNAAQPIPVNTSGATVTIGPGGQASATPSPTLAPGSPTATPAGGTAVTGTPTQVAVATSTETPTMVPTATPAPLPTNTAVASATLPPTESPSPTVTPTQPLGTPVESTNLSPLATPTSFVVATLSVESPLATPTALVRASPTARPTATRRPTPTASATATPAEVASDVEGESTSAPDPRTESPIAPGGFLGSLWFIISLVGLMILGFAVLVAIPRARKS